MHTVHTGLLAVSFYLLVGATLSLILKKFTFQLNFAEIWQGKCSGITRKLGSRGSLFDIEWLLTYFPFSLI